MSNYLKALLITLVFAGAAFSAHYLTLEGLEASDQWAESGYTLSGLYIFETVCTLAVVLVVLLAQWSMPKNVGFVFLGLVLVKGIANYIYIQDGLGLFENKFIELNFLAVYFLFLFFDVFMAYRAINQGETKS